MSHINMQTTNEAAAMEILTYIASEVPRYGGKLSNWAYSPDTIDTWAASGLRDRAASLAKLVYADFDLAVRCHLALGWACRNDEYAMEEIFRRFPGAVKQLRRIAFRKDLAAKIERHPRARHFASLIAALVYGRPSQAQIDLGKRLAAEVSDVSA